MGLLKELFLCRTALEGIEQSKAAEIKKHIIQQNIYGVDIEKGAVDIARLRFWLSLIVDEETPQALPGNSLLEQYDGVDLSVLMTEEIDFNEIGVHATFFDDEFYKEKQELQALLNEYYECIDHKQKKSLRKSIVTTIKKQIHDRGLSINFEDIDLAGNDQFMLWHTWFHDVFSQGGFDIVIANPPYVDAKKLKAIAPNLKKFKVFNGAADLYTYFYEMALNMLTPKGVLTFITSNKWIRSEYGRKLRKMFLENEILQLIDFGRNRLFRATVDSNIISVKKEPKEVQPSLYYFDENTEGSSLMEMLKYGEVKNVHLSEEAWLLKAGENDRMKSKIESLGIPLIDFGVNIFRGILTGFNKAYHIDETEKERLIHLDGNNSSIIKPLMCGSDTDKFYCKPPQLWIINIHNGIKGGDIKPIDINNYPIIKRRLDIYYDALSNRNDKGSTPYNLRNCAYLLEFEREKIIWQAISKRIAFSYDPLGKYYCDVTTYFMTGNNLKYILAILNSKLFEYALLKIYLEGDTFKSKNAIIQNFPVPPINEKSEKIIDIVDSIISKKQGNPSADTSALESKIDSLVYQLYGLTEEEIKIVEQSK